MGHLFSPIEAIMVSIKLLGMRKEKNVINSGKFLRASKMQAFLMNTEYHY